jgi:hypothetical protein
MNWQGKPCPPTPLYMNCSNNHSKSVSRGFRFSCIPLVALTLLAGHPAQAALTVVVTYAQDSDALSSSLANTSVLDFNSITPSTPNTPVTDYVWMNGAATVGTIDQVYVRKADMYGGAGGTGNYAAQGGAWPVYTPTTTITFPTGEGHAYFGLWWSAGDANNVLTFYSGTTVVAELTTGNLLNKLAASRAYYYGNPNTAFLNQNNTEAYAFINLYGDLGTTWDKIVFSNLGSSGFESDNWTDRVGAWGTGPGEAGAPVPGVQVATVSGYTVTMSSEPIPEPSSVLCLSATLGLLAFRRRR